MIRSFTNRLHSARLQYLYGWCIGDTAVLHWAIDIMYGYYRHVSVCLYQHSSVHIGAVKYTAYLSIAYSNDISMSKRHYHRLAALFFIFWDTFISFYTYELHSIHQCMQNCSAYFFPRSPDFMTYGLLIVSIHEISASTGQIMTRIDSSESWLMFLLMKNIIDKMGILYEHGFASYLNCVIREK